MHSITFIINILFGIYLIFMVSRKQQPRWLYGGLLALWILWAITTILKLTIYS